MTIAYSEFPPYSSFSLKIFGRSYNKTLIWSNDCTLYSLFFQYFGQLAGQRVKYFFLEHRKKRFFYAYSRNRKLFLSPEVGEKTSPIFVTKNYLKIIKIFSRRQNFF